MDPAGPLFVIAVSSNRLASTDAKFVEVIHTSAGKLGFFGNLGHVDYWPNGGQIQPGCDDDTYGECAHGRSFYYYAESLISGNFVSWQCASYAYFNLGYCKNETKSFMGQLSLDKT